MHKKGAQSSTGQQRIRCSSAELSARDTVEDPDPRLLLFFSLQSGSKFQIVSLKITNDHPVCPCLSIYL
jgi:hypothetical protein